MGFPAAFANTKYGSGVSGEERDRDREEPSHVGERDKPERQWRVLTAYGSSDPAQLGKEVEQRAWSNQSAARLHWKERMRRKGAIEREGDLSSGR